MKERTSGLLRKRVSSEKTKEKPRLRFKRQKRRSCRLCAVGEEHNTCERSGRRSRLKRLREIKGEIWARGLGKEVSRPSFKNPVISSITNEPAQLIRIQRSNIIHFPQPNRRIA